MNTLILTNNQNLATTDLTAIGQIANEAAAAHIFSEYQGSKADQTNRRHAAGLACFSAYLAAVGIDRPALALGTDPAAWGGLSWGIVEGFKRWQLSEGYAVASINHRLSTVKNYAAMAHKAGGIDDNQAALIRSIRGYSHKDGVNLDKKREQARRGHKKSEATGISKDQAAQLKSQPDTPQGRRDALIMYLLLDHGLRCGELSALQVGDFDLAAGELRFYRPKVNLVQTHRLTVGTLAAARRYLASDAPALGPLLRGSDKAGRLTAAGMSEQAITARVRTLGERVGITALSAHDGRHYWATAAARAGTAIDRLQQAGGWSSPAMPLRYIALAEIANEGVTLG